MTEFDPTYDYVPMDDPGMAAIQDAGTQNADMITEVPQSTEQIDGRDVVVTGDVSGIADFGHQQGDNDLGYQGDCGLVSCENILDSFGISVTENDIVHYAVDNNLCDEGDGTQAGSSPDVLGGTSEAEQAQILTDHGIPAHQETGLSLDDLASTIEGGQGAIAEVNAGVIWNDASAYDTGAANHAIVVSGVARDATSGEVVGFYVNDSGDGQAGKFIDADTFQQAWADTGGSCVLTDTTHV